MVAAPQYAVMTFRSEADPNVTYTKEVYLSDVAAAPVRWDAGNGAGSASETSWTPPEDVILDDFAIPTGMTDTTKMQMTADGTPTGDILRYAPYVNTINNRPLPNIPFAGGVKIGANQLA